MPAPVSKKQYRYMMAILHGKKDGTSARGDRVPKSVAGKYAGSAPKDAPESKGKAHEGGVWGEKHKSKDKKKVEQKRADKKKLKKAIEEYITGQGHRGAGCLVVDDSGLILLGRRTDNGLWATPGGKVEPDESFEEGALRELREEAGIVGRQPEEIHSHAYGGWESKTFLVKSFKGRLKDNGEMSALKFFEPHELPWDRMTHYTMDAIQHLIKDRLKKSKEIKYLLAEEQLQKNIMRSGSAPANTIYEVTHGDALRLVGNGTFRMLREVTKDMQDEEVKDVHLDQYTLNIRKHVNDVYSGRIIDGHKQIHQFTGKSLPAVAAELMSVFEWYAPEDEPELELLDDSDLSDDVIEGGLHELIDKYKRHNISNIYSEMENIREEVRNGMAVDLQQVEQKMMKLFDKLENVVTDIADKHNMLGDSAGNAIDELEEKLMSLQAKIENLSRQPVTMEAYSSQPKDGAQIHSENYPYLPRPKVEIDPSGKITISFAAEWAPMERENFLKDMKARVIKSKK